MNLLGIMRRTRGLSQEDVGRATGIRPKTLSDYEHGLRPPPGNLLKLAVFFQVPAEEAAELMREVSAAVVEDLPRTVLERVGATV